MNVHATFVTFLRACCCVWQPWWYWPANVGVALVIHLAIRVTKIAHDHDAWLDSDLERLKMLGAKKHVITRANGVDVHCEVAGTGSPTVVINAGTCTTASNIATSIDFFVRVCVLGCAGAPPLSPVCEGVWLAYCCR